MIRLLILWSVLCFLSFGVLGLYYLLMKRMASKPWQTNIDSDYKPRISILVPTYNESDIITYKLQNLSRVEYPRELTQVIVVDSKSEDHTVGVVNDYAKQHPDIDIEVLVEDARKGKSAALNSALRNCEGEVVIVSDADCFWPGDILQKALPFLSDPSVGAISGPKLLLNANQSRTTKSESKYLASMNSIKLGESKACSTLFFEGGFSAYKKKLLDSFDPYETGSDDCGTVVSLIEKKSRALLVPEAFFYTTFPSHLGEKLLMKTRRANQLIRVFAKYLVLLLGKKVGFSRKTIVPNLFIYLFSPFFFVFLLAVTSIVIFEFPYFALLLLLFFVPKVGPILIEALQGYSILFYSYLTIVVGKSFLQWKKPADRHLFTEEILRQHHLI